MKNKFIKTLLIVIPCIILVGGSTVYATKIFVDNRITNERESEDFNKINRLIEYYNTVMRLDDTKKISELSARVISEYRGYDENKVENDEVRNFLVMCREGVYTFE